MLAAGMGCIAVTGSVAYDTIMVFPGRFAEHILPEQTHVLNVSFLVDRLERRPGGTAANIAYTLALLDEHPLLCAAVGNDFAEYGAALKAIGVDTSRVLLCDDVCTATCFITTDIDDNQITAFFAGAMGRAAEIDLHGIEDLNHVVVAPDAPAAMAAHTAQARELGSRLVFAPAQQIPSLTQEQLEAGLDAAWLVVGNDYEFEMIRKRTGRTIDQLAGTAMVAVTRGGEGSTLHADGSMHRIPSAQPRSLVDPTGAGDAYIAGLLAAIRRGQPMETAGRVAALAATYVIEQRGPQGHHYTYDDFRTRYADAFGVTLPASQGC